MIGDRVRLGDTNLFVEVERDYAGYGDETLWGFGKTIRDGLQMRSRSESEAERNARDDRFGNPNCDGKLPVARGATERPQHPGWCPSGV